MHEQANDRKLILQSLRQASEMDLHSRHVKIILRKIVYYENKIKK